jgi:PTS system nitrogen regulatory IIA component
MSTSTPGASPATGFHAKGGRSAVRVGHASRDITMHITLDAQHAWPLRQALIRDCAGQSWTICIALLPGCERMRLSLTLPRSAVDDAMVHIDNLAPGAEVTQCVEVPDKPSGAWQDLINGAATRHGSVDGEFAPLRIGGILHEDDIVLDADVADRPALFRRIGALAAQRYGLDADAVATSLVEREALGSTALGQGVALPHGRVGGVPREVAFYIRLANPIAFDAPDGGAVSDLVCLLLPDWGTNAHLHLLASVAECFCDHRFRESLRQAKDAQSVCRLFSSK